MRNLMRTGILFLLAWLSVAHVARAEILIDSGTPTAGGGLTISPTQALTQQITLAAPATIGEIAVSLARVGTGAAPVVKIQVSRGVGLGTPTSSLIAEHLVTVSNSSPAFLAVATNFSLAAGTYYIVLSTASDPANSAFWSTSAPTELGMRMVASGANIDALFPPASRFLPFTPGTVGDKFGLRISGTPLPPPPPMAHVPELYLSSTRTTASITAHSVLRYNEVGQFTDAFIPDRLGGLRNPRAVIMGPDGNVYVSSFSPAGNGITGILRYDGATGDFKDVFAQKPVFDPFGLAFGPDGNLYVTDLTANQVVRFDGATGALIGVFTTGSAPSAPRGLVFGPDGNLYVSSPGDLKVKRYDGLTGASLGDFATSVDARDLLFGPDGHLYVASFNNSRVLRFDGTTGAFRDTFALGGGLDGPVGLRYGPDGNLYVGSFNNYGVIRFDGLTGSFIDIFVHYGIGGLGQPRIFTFILPVSIDIKPGTDPNEINARSRGVVPVAILSTAGFDATRIDPASLRFAGAAVARAGGKLMCHEQDVGGAPNGSPDGWLDLVCQFDTQQLQLSASSTTAVLTGLADGVPIRGEDQIVSAGY